MDAGGRDANEEGNGDWIYYAVKSQTLESGNC